MRLLNLKGVAASLFALSLAACGSSNCKEFLLDSKESPHNRYTAGTFVRKCRGGQATVTHVNLHDGISTPPPGLNGTITSGEVFSVEGERKVALVWKDNNNLLVECEGCGAQKPSLKEGLWRDVKISYAVK